MIVITGEFEIHPEDAWPATSAALEMMEASQQEEGCYLYRFYADILSSRHLRVYEEWRDEAAVKAHNESPHMAVFREKFSKLRILNRRVYRMNVEEITPI